ncbi:MAG TPA: oligopeptide transporter, OPT family [Pirellulales bacterium]|jgi:putative OPT family oligopeptide transporter|nr:oligopeptide transporter, OPT family [Pirellulales bacterium]
MAAPVTTENDVLEGAVQPPAHRPFVPDEVHEPEFTWPAVTLGAVLGIVFGASSLYLVLKVGMTVSASIPVAVLSITLFRVFTRVLGLRRATILENNIVQTTGSAGESIAFGVGVTIPALMLLGFDMSVVRVMTVGVLGGLLGILMMIPLRRAFIVKQHAHLPYPEGTACAEVLIVGERGGATARTVFAGFGVALVHKFCTQALKLWKDVVDQPLYTASGQGLNRGVIGGELTPELLGVGYIIGPRIGAIMVSGAILAYLVMTPLIYMFGRYLDAPLPPADRLLVRNMDVREIRNAYILYIGAGAVATGGILSMLQALPLILASLRSGMRDLIATRDDGQPSARVPRTERDLSLKFVLLGCVGLVIALSASPELGLGWSLHGVVGALLIVFFGFLFVTVSSRLTGQIGSSSNPISGMTVATLLLTCLVFVAIGRTGGNAPLTALSVAAVVCIAASNGGTTSQDLKTGYLIGATPRWQQLAILVGALTSALVIGLTLLLLNEAGTVYTKRTEFLPDYRVKKVEELTQREHVGGEYADTDHTLYRVKHFREGESKEVQAGKYLVDDTGRLRYLVDPAINGRVDVRDNGDKVPNKFEAPKTKLMALIIDGILNGRLPWELVIIGALVAVVLELAGVPSLPFAVGVYLPIETSVPIFIGGAVRWAIDRRRGSAIESEGSPGVLLSSGYIAGGSIGGVLIAFLSFAPAALSALAIGSKLPAAWQSSDWPALAMFIVLIVVLGLVAGKRSEK